MSFAMFRGLNIILVCSLFTQSVYTGSQNEIITQTMILPEVVGNFFYYFGFGSNLLAKRIHISNKSAVRQGLGHLKDHRLDFNYESPRWNGSAATIIPTNGSEVYGAIWKIDLTNLPDLDRQEGVKEGIYIPMSLPIETSDGSVITCRAYYLTKQPEVPYSQQPSKTYLKVIVKGAIETGAPESYVNWLKAIQHNGNLVDAFEKELELESVELSS